jgi:hypothetical protein
MLQKPQKGFIKEVKEKWQKRLCSFAIMAKKILKISLVKLIKLICAQVIFFQDIFQLLSLEYNHNLAQNFI